MSRAEFERRRALRPEMNVLDYVPPEDFDWEYCENSITIRGNVLDISLRLNGVEVQNEFHIRRLKFTEDYLGFETVDSYNGIISVRGDDYKHIILDFGN